MPGQRFVDEGADFRNYTYAKYGRVILEQPDQFAWQIFDQKVKHLQRDEYNIRRITKVTADTIEELAQSSTASIAAQFVQHHRRIQQGRAHRHPFNPNVKDGRRARGARHSEIELGQHDRRAALRGLWRHLRPHLHLRRLAHHHRRRVVDLDFKPIPGLYAAGELVGGLFYFNYPGGSGLTSGAVFGRIAGAEAARAAKG